MIPASSQHQYAAPEPLLGTIPAVPLPPIRIPPVNPVPLVPPPNVPTAPPRGPSTVPVNPFVNPWAPPPRVPAQGGAQPSVVPRRPVSGIPYPTVSGTAAVPPIPAFVPILGPIMDLRLRVAYPIFKGKRHEDPDLHIASFEQTMNINGENSVHKARLFPATLKQNAFAWYSQLDPQTQSDWDDVKNEFLEQFRVAQKDPDIMYQIQNMKQQEKETIKEFLTRFRLMIRKLEVPSTDAQKITWLRNAVHQRFITSVEDRGYANEDDFEDKLKTCAYSMAYRDGAFSNERDAYRRSDQDSEDEHSDDSTGTRKKKRYLREQRTEQKLVNHWKKALSSIGKDRAQQNTPTPMRYCHICNNNLHDTRVRYYNAKNSQTRQKDVPVHTIEEVKETSVREKPKRNYPRRNYGEGSSQPQTGQLECYYCYEKGHIKRNCTLFKKHMDERRTSKTPHVTGSNAIYVELKRNESVSVMTREMRRQAPEPEAIPGSEPDNDLTPLRRWDKEDNVVKDTIDFIQEMQTSDEQEDVEVDDEGDYFPFNNMEPPNEDPNLVSTSIPENVWKKNMRRRTDEEPSNLGKRVRFTIEVEEPQAVEQIAKKLTEKFLQQKAEITMQELFNLAPYCKELMLRSLLVLPKTASEISTPEGTIPDKHPIPDEHPIPDVSKPDDHSLPDEKDVPDGTDSEPEIGVASIAHWMDMGQVLQIQVKGMRLPNILIDGGSGTNVISAELYMKFKDVALHPAPFNLKMADQRRVLPLGMVKDLPIRIKDMTFDIDAVVFPMEQTKSQVPMILGRPWLRHHNVRQEWDLTKNYVDLMWRGERRRISTVPRCIPNKASIQPIEVCTLNWEDGLSEEEEMMLQWALPSLWTIAEIDIEPIESASSSDSKKEESERRQVRFNENTIVPEKKAGEELNYPKTLSWKRTMVEIEDNTKAARWLQTSPAKEVLKKKVHSYTIAQEGTYEEINLATEDNPKLVKIGNHLSEEQKEGIIKLLKDYSRVFAWTYEDMKGVPPKICQHKIKLLPSAKPMVQRPYRMNPNYAETVRKEIEKLKEADFIYPVKEYDWLSPIVIVPKKNGKLRVCVDYRKLNEFIVKDPYHIPFIDDILDKVAGREAYTFMDGYSGYNQVEISPDDRKKTAFITPWGAYAYARMPFGLSNAPATFQSWGLLAQPQDPKVDLPIYFASRTLNNSEKDYTTTEREALAMVYAVKKFKPYLQGNKFVFFVDHQALTYIVNKVHITGRIARWLLLLQEFDFTVVYKPGKINILADQLSRIEMGREIEHEDDSFPDEYLLNINLEKPDDHISSGDETDDTKRGETYEGLLKGGWQTPMRYLLTRRSLPKDTPYHIKRKLAQKSSQYTFIEGELYKKGIDQVLRRCVNEEDVPKILEEAHEGPSGGHGARESTAQKILHTGLWWPTIFKDCHSHVRTCNECQRSATLKEGMPLKPIFPLGVFQKWGLDFIGPIKPASFPTGKRYIITATDYTTKWVEAECYRTNDKKVTAKFIYENIITRFGVPVELVSDQGGHFLNGVIAELTTHYQVKHRFSTPYYPQCNGQAESTNKILIVALRKLVERHPINWDASVPSVLWAMRTAYKATTNHTPFHMVYGVEALVPMEFIVHTLRIATEYNLNPEEMLQRRLKELLKLEESREQAFSHQCAVQERRKRYIDKHRKMFNFKKDDKVLHCVATGTIKRRKLKYIWEGPYTVLEVQGNGNICIESEDKSHIRIVNGNKLRPYGVNKLQEEILLWNRLKI
ncbi:hypothetical protein R1sor_019772 [Riccia sorocarpa]|uniref:Reverse transcriptase n=1 Tax=Riccia sorocarpa TaxID=122646 RepID=A0ABD3IH94_9MARC